VCPLKHPHGHEPQVARCFVKLFLNQSLIIVDVLGSITPPQWYVTHPSQRMPFSTREISETVVFQITGKFLGSLEGEAFKETIEELKESGKKQVVIDLSKADFMDSSGIGTLIGAFTSMKKVDGDVKLAGMKERIKNLFLLTRLLGPVFEEYDTVDEAIASMQ